MTENIRPYAPQGPGPQDQPSTGAVARDQAASVGRSAGEAGSRVAQTATDQAREVVSEAAYQARDLLGEASGHARDQASVQQQNAARQLRTVADEMQEMAAKGGQSGVATEIAQQAAERIHGAASWLERREPADLLQAVRDRAFGQPGAAAMTSPEPRTGAVVGQPGRDVSGASVGELFSEVAQDLSTLMRQELALAKAEVKEEAVKAGRAAGMFGAAGFAGYMVLLFASIAAWWGLGAVMAKGWAALIVTAIWAVIGAALFAVARRRMREVNPKPERTTETVKELPGTLKGAVRR